MRVRISADDVRSKKFAATQFRRGYSEVEVDEFLDAVAVELRELVREGDSLRERLADRTGLASLSPVSKVMAGISNPPLAPRDKPDSHGMLAMAQEVHDRYVAEGYGMRAKLISEGQALHDEVHASRAKILAEAADRHETLVSAAREQAAGIVSEGREKKARILGGMAGSRDLLQARVDALTAQEAEGRANLRAFLQGHIDILGADVGPPQG